MKDISHSFNGKIWKTLPDPAHFMLAAEIRDQDLHNTCFAVIDLEGGRIIEENISLEENWWIRLEYFRWPIIYLMTFEDEIGSSGGNLVSFNVKQKSAGWTIPDFEPVRWGENEAHGYAIVNGNRELRVVDLRNGLMKAPPLNTLPPAIRQGPETAGLFYPVQYLEGDEYFETVREFLSQRKIECCLALEYLEFMDYVIIGYYIRDRQGLANFLLILGRKGEVLFHDKTGEALAGIGLETYFVLGRFLVYSRNKRILKIVTLL